MQKIKILNVEYNNCTLEQAAADVFELANTLTTHYVVTPNAEIAENCFLNPQLLEAVQNADYCIPDGIGVVLASCILKKPLMQRVAGYDLAISLLPMLAQQRMRLYILGAALGVAQKAADNIRANYPLINIVGTQNGYFKNNKEIIDKINIAKPDVLFVALGSPKQEVWMYRNRFRINAGVMLGIGGAVDVIAGVAKRSPKIFIKLNLEWFYRLLCHPSRFFRMMKLPKYILRAIWTRMFNKVS
jgi:N-acetylglucosaminyldiphosphoundecaprenol N-acetyl-beta-D-mannosaminyltransferase